MVAALTFGPLGGISNRIKSKEADMILNYSPVRHDQKLFLERKGQVLIVNGHPYDFTNLPEGALLPVDAIDCPWFAGPVERIEGVLVFRLILPHGAEAPEDTLYPMPQFVAEDGPIEVPSYNKPEEENLDRLYEDENQ